MATQVGEYSGFGGGAARSNQRGVGGSSCTCTDSISFLEATVVFFVKCTFTAWKLLVIVKAVQAINCNLLEVQTSQAVS